MNSISIMCFGIARQAREIYFPGGAGAGADAVLVEMHSFAIGVCLFDIVRPQLGSMHNELMNLFISDNRTTIIMHSPGTSDCHSATISIYYCAVAVLCRYA